MMQNKPKVVFLLASIAQPRCHKRIQSFIEKGFEVEVYGFDRGLYNVNSKIEGYKVNSFGAVPSGSGYIKKFLNARSELKRIFLRNRNEKTIYYCFSFDLALVCKLYGKQYFYEISDLVYGYFKSKIVRKVFTIIDKRIIAGSILTIMTSKGFYDFLFPLNSSDKIVLQPNRVSSFFSPKDRPSPKALRDGIVFSYVGAFRYPNTVFRFAKVIGEKYPQHSFYFFGDSQWTETVKDLAIKYKNVEYFGSYKNPEDLADIYSKIDIVVACYDIQTLNERVAEPNKLYESLYFNKPIIVSKNTFLEKQVLEKFECGYAIDATKDNNIIDLIESLDKTSLIHTVNKIQGVDIQEIIDDNSGEIFKSLNLEKYQR